MPAVAVDVVVLTLGEGQPHVLLIRRKNPPHQDRWALPGGFVEVGGGYAPGEQGESLDDAAARELREETAISVDRDGLSLEQLHTFGAPGRDPRGRVISVVYYGLVANHVVSRVQAGDDAAEARWFHAREAAANGVGGHALAFDHERILIMALERIERNAEQDPHSVRALVPETFTPADLRSVYEGITGPAFDDSHFSRRFRRMLRDESIVATEDHGQIRGTSRRPPRRYRFPK